MESGEIVTERGITMRDGQVIWATVDCLHEYYLAMKLDCIVSFEGYIRELRRAGAEIIDNKGVIPCTTFRL